jgi:hypothetical protein
LLKCFAVTAAITLLAYSSMAVSITAIGGVSRVIDSSDLLAGAGSDLHDTYESPADATAIEILDCTGTAERWRVDVSRSDLEWNNNLVLYARVTSNGVGDGTVSGGGDFQEVTSSPSTFFSGVNNRQFIYVQYKLTGESVQVPIDKYRSTVTFTVVDI